MNELDYSFEDSPWEKYLRQLKQSDTVDAAYLLTLMEGESEDAVEDAFQMLEELTAQLDVANLPRPAFSGESGARLRQEMELAQRGLPFEELEVTDPLRLYLEELAAIPVCGEVSALAEKLAQANREQKANESLRTALMDLSLSRVVELAGAYTGRGVLLLDLIQEGSIGLWRATESFDGRGEDFAAIRDWWIRFSMAKAVLLQARDTGTGQKLRQAMEDYRQIDERLLTDLGRNPTLEEIAEELHLSVEETDTIRKMMDNARMIDRVNRPEEPEEPEEEEQAVEDTALFQMRQRIADLLSDLSEADAQLLTLRFGLEGAKPMTPEETGRALNLTPQEVVAREAAALAKLREK